MKKHKPSPLFKDFPDYLKNPRNLKTIEKKLEIKSDHTHKTIGQYARCERCEVGRMKRKRVMKELGFKDFKQFMEWKKIMSYMLQIKKIQNGKK